MRKTIFAFGTSLGANLLAATRVFAQGTTQVEIPQPNAVKITNVGSLISALIGWVLIIAALAFFFMLVIGGLQWIVSGGDKAQTEAARGRITAALIGLIIVFAAWAIMRLIEAFIGVSIIGGPITFPRPY